MNKNLDEQSFDENTLNTMLLFLKNKLIGFLLSMITALEVLKLVDLISYGLLERKTLMTGYLDNFTMLIIFLYFAYLVVLSSRTMEMRNNFLGVSMLLMGLNIIIINFQISNKILIVASITSLIGLIVQYLFIDKESVILEGLVLEILEIEDKTK